MERHMHVTEEVHEEFESFVLQLVAFLNNLSTDPILQYPSHVPQRAENIPTFPPLPPPLSRKDTGIRGMIAKGTDVMERSGPTLPKAHFVCPCSDGCDVAWEGVGIG
jgi:hypothetical protein